MPTTSNTDRQGVSASLPGKKDCPICGGVGFVRQELPPDHPNFGKLQICSCRQQQAMEMESSRLYRLSNLEAFSAMTIETFNAKGRFGLADDQMASLKYALNQANHYAQSLQGWLVFMGGYGCGKTHLAAAVANYAVGMGVATLFLTVPDLLDWLRFSYDNPAATFESRFDEIRNVRLLVLDDLGTQNATPWAQEKLYQIINHRYISRLPTVITTNIDLDDMDGRIRSRLEDPDLVNKVRIKAPDFRSPVRDSTHPQLSSLHLHANRTFGTFSLREQDKMSPEERKNLEKVWHTAQKYAEKPRGWIVFSGTYGTGKTHLAAAIGNYRAALGDTPMFVVVPDLLDHLRAAFSPSSNVSYDSMFEEVLTSRMLILDDLGTQSATPWAREKLYQIFNYRYNAELPTIITTSLPLEEIDPRIRSRMLDSRICTILGIQFPPFRISTVLKSTRSRKTN